MYVFTSCFFMFAISFCIPAKVTIYTAIRLCYILFFFLARNMKS